jgi:hypothetical protein
MGNEAQCEARYGEQKGRGKALLETKELIFRGDFRVVIPFAEMKSVEAKSGTLSLTHKGTKAAFDVGANASRWAEKIKNPKGRADKLGLKAGQKVAVVGVEDASFKTELEGRVGEVTWGKPRPGSDAIFLAVSETKDLKKIVAMKPLLQKAGALWLIRPKGAGAAVTERETMAAGKAAGLVDVKVVAFSETHSAEKYVIPVAKR